MWRALVGLNKNSDSGSLTIDAGFGKLMGNENNITMEGPIKR